jgi:hypothetical protein
MDLKFKLYCINRQLDLLTARADRIGPGPCRDSLILRIAALNIDHALTLARAAKILKVIRAGGRY